MDIKTNSIRNLTCAWLLLAGPSMGNATPFFHAVYESDPGGLNNVNFVNYDTLADLEALNSASTMSWNFASGVSMSALAYDGNQFHAVYESDPGGLNNVNFVSYDSLADLKALNSASTMSWNFASGVSMSGLTFDGNQFHAVFESDPGGLNNVNFVSYDSLAELKALSFASTMSWNFASGVSMSGLAYDDNQFHAVFESDPGGLNNVNFVSYDSLAELKALNSASTMSWNFASGVSMSGLAFEGAPVVNNVPEPTALWLLIIGLPALLTTRPRFAREKR